MPFAALPPESQGPSLSLALWPPAAEPDWVSEFERALPPLPRSLPPVTFSFPPGSFSPGGGDPYERLLAALSVPDGKADSVWFG
jgi:hypothetical protein